MITNIDLSKAVFKFFDLIFANNKTDFLFNSNSNYAFVDSYQNNSIRKDDQTILFYNIEDSDNMGNRIKSDIVIYNRDTNKEEVIITKKLNVTFNILSKKKGMAKDAMMAFSAYVQSSRLESLNNALPFKMYLINSEKENNLTALETGAWVERMEKRLLFAFNDKIEIGDIQFTQLPSSVENVKNIVQNEIIIK
jgi:hypothetical protein